MAHKFYLPNLLLLALSVSHCGGDPDASATSGSEAASPGEQTATAAPAPAASGARAPAPAAAGSPVATAASGSAAAPSGNASRPGNAAAGSGGTSPGPSSDVDAGTQDTGGSAGAAGAAGDAAAGAAAGSGTAGADAPSGMIPEPTDMPYVWGVGVGVSDVAAAVKFYTEVMAMDVEKENVQREDRVETVLASTKAGRGSRLVLMKYNDAAREVRKISAKLVWQAPSPSSVNTAARMHPDYVSRLNIGIVQFDGPDTYIQEVGSSFDPGGAGIMEPYQVALGFAVTDQRKTVGFWEMAFGMEESPLGTFTVTDATGTGSIAEVSLQIPTGGGSGLVPQVWSPMRNAKDNPVKVIVFVPDAQAVADKIMGAGGSIAQPAARSDAYDNRLLVVAKDPDGYLVEIVQ
jgi:catechol 2,3-dioxygenase-like lactoylglutathione lyase family enzyme